MLNRMAGFYIFENMKMKRFYLILALMSVSLVGIIVVQWLWLHNAIDIREENYDRDVREALAQTVSQLDKKRNMVFMSEKIGNHLPDSISFQDKLSPADSLDRVINPKEMVRFYQEKELEAEDKLREERQVIAEKLNTAREHLHDEKKEGERLTGLPIDSMLRSMDMDIPNRDSLRDKIVISINEKRMVVDSLKNLPVPNSEALEKMELDMRAVYEKLRQVDLEVFYKQLEEQTRKMQDVFKQMAMEYRLHFDSIRQTVPYAELDTMLDRELNQRGIEVDYAYAVLDESKGELLYESAGFQPEEKQQAYRTNVFPSDLIRKDLFLLLQIPRKKVLILQSISYLLLGSLIFTAVIIITFGIALHTLLRQKKLSDIKSDFINNMTHEFKTPIATISLAADSIANPRTLADREKIMNFIRVIKSENKRMNSQVERVLQMSLLDRKDFELDLQLLHLHPLLDQVVNNTRVQLEKNGGAITYEPVSVRDLSWVDEEHFLNVLYNLIDNAIKYSSGTPEITIRTQTKGDRICISVADRGMGIRREDQKRIFDKFYRVGSGNIHNVKGFGLGLSYVATMVKHFGGEIRVDSEYGKGTRFDVELPLKSPDDGAGKKT